MTMFNNHRKQQSSLLSDSIQLFLAVLWLNLLAVGRPGTTTWWRRWAGRWTPLCCLRSIFRCTAAVCCCKLVQ